MLARLLAAASLALALAATPATAPPIGAEPPAHGPAGALDHVGRWLVDEQGRIVQLHGVNMVQKWPAEDPMTPAEVGFDEDDAVFIREQGWNVVRLGVVFGAVMPDPGVIDQEYVDSIAETARMLGDEGIYVLLDFHQDGYGPAVHGNGFPEWATLTDGLPNPPVGFPNYYVENPALQRAFDNFWENELGPDGVPLQQHYATAMQAMAAAVVDDPMILGIDAMNEPWPGADWMPCVSGCPELEQTRLKPFEERMAAAVHAVDPDRFVFAEPFVLFNFGQSPTTVGGVGAPHNGLSFHVYALSPEAEIAVIDHAIAASASNGAALAATEFGATTDPTFIDRLASALDGRLVPWMFWSYDENVVIDLMLPPEGGNVHEPVVRSLTRAYAVATNGTPIEQVFHLPTSQLDVRWSTTRTDGAVAPGELATVINAPPTAYPSGYSVEVTGGWVASEPGSPQLLVCNAPGATEVQVRVVAGSRAAPPAPRPCEPHPPVEPAAQLTERAVATPRFTG